MIRALAAGLALLAVLNTPLLAQPPLLDRDEVAALAGELSGETAKRNLEFLARYHRMRGSREFRIVAEHIAQECRDYGMDDVELVELPVDGERFYGTQKGRPAWDAEFAELWEIDAQGRRLERVASFDAMPVSLAQDSESADVTAELVDVGAGTDPSDYEGKSIEGKLVLTSSQPGAAASLAVDEYGAAGLLSYAQNQRSAWWKEDKNLVRWGHVGSFREKDTFAFMISLKRARAYRDRLAAGETVRFEAKVEAGKHDGFYTLVTAAITGTDLAHEEIVYSCHLDHQKPGANDNASGSVTILEIARTFAKLIQEGRLERPRRTIRFVWPPEIEGTVALLADRPQWAESIVAAIHLDMVGGGPNTKAVFHVTKSPGSLPTFINDVAATWGRFVNQQSEDLAGGGDPPFPLAAPEGGKEALLAQMAPFSMGSDHQVYSEGSWRIPSVYLNDWPDRYIHTNFDTPANVDPTKLLRSGFIGAASGWTLATLAEDDLADLWPVLESASLRRTADVLERLPSLTSAEADLARRFHVKWEGQSLGSVARFADIADWHQRIEDHVALVEQLVGPVEHRSDGSSPVYARTDLKGPLSVFGYDYLSDHLGEREAPSLLSYSGDRGSGSAYAYEVLNLVDGQRTVADIRDEVSAIYGPVSVDVVSEFLSVLASIGVVAEK